MYTKVRGHHCWWLAKDGKSIAQFDINGLTSDAEAEAYVDEIVNSEHEVLDLLRFMCNVWTDIDKWAYENMPANALGSYPVIQGTRNQLNLNKIGEQEFDKDKLIKGVEWMLSQKPTAKG